MENVKRKYFEVWGDLEAQNNTLKALLLSMTGLLLISLVVVYMVTIKPPVVIRIGDVGKAEAVSRYNVNNAITEPELFYFTKLFVQKFTEYNSYTIATDIAEAFNMMSANYQKIAKKEVLDSNLISKISQASINTKMEVREIKLEREDPNYAVLSLLGLRTIQSYQNRDLKEESLFKGDIILKKVPRTMDCPQGLLVEEYREVLVKKIEK
jgi:hypothetical protein